MKSKETETSSYKKEIEEDIKENKNITEMLEESEAPEEILYSLEEKFTEIKEKDDFNKILDIGAGSRYTENQKEEIVQKLEGGKRYVFFVRFPESFEELERDSERFIYVDKTEEEIEVQYLNSLREI